jgi:methionyl-tRNA synthetase
MWYTLQVKPTIPFSDFSKLDILVGTIEKVEQLKGTDNLLVLTADLGDKKSRKLVAGIAKTHESSELVGKQVVVVANLEAKEIKGVESQGMLLAADISGKPVLLAPEKEVPAGAKVR